MAAQVAALLVQARPDLMKRENRVTLLVAAAASTMASAISRSSSQRQHARAELVDFNAPQNMAIDLRTEAGMAATLNESTELWVPLYFALALLQRMYEQVPGSAATAMHNLM